MRLVLYDLAAGFDQTLPSSTDIVDGNFKHWAQSGASLDKQVDAGPMKADHFRVRSGNFKAKPAYVKGRRGFGLGRLDENVCAEGVGHLRSFLRMIIRCQATIAFKWRIFSPST